LTQLREGRAGDQRCATTDKGRCGWRRSREAPVLHSKFVLHNTPSVLLAATQSQSPPHSTMLIFPEYNCISDGAQLCQSLPHPHVPVILVVPPQSHHFSCFSYQASYKLFCPSRRTTYSPHVLCLSRLELKSNDVHLRWYSFRDFARLTTLGPS
jgi:hypothetical protein